MIQPVIRPVFATYANMVAQSATAADWAEIDAGSGAGGPCEIAVVGTGISGMSAAWLLSSRHEVTVYERADRIGGHSNTVDAHRRGATVPVDTGFIVYNEQTYPNLTALFDHLNVPTQASDMSFAVSLDGGALEYCRRRTRRRVRAEAQPRLRPRFWSMLRDLRRFYRDAPARHRDGSTTPASRSATT